MPATLCGQGKPLWSSSYSRPTSSDSSMKRFEPWTWSTCGWEVTGLVLRVTTVALLCTQFRSTYIYVSRLLKQVFYCAGWAIAMLNISNAVFTRSVKYLSRTAVSLRLLCYIVTYIPSVLSMLVSVKIGNREQLNHSGLLGIFTPLNAEPSWTFTMWDYSYICLQGQDMGHNILFVLSQMLQFESTQILQS